MAGPGKTNDLDGCASRAIEEVPASTDASPSMTWRSPRRLDEEHASLLGVAAFAIATCKRDSELASGLAQPEPQGDS